MNIKKIFLNIAVSLFSIFLLTAFIVSDPKADVYKKKISLTDEFSLEEISTDNTKKGSFKTSVKFKMNSANGNVKEFYGQEIMIENNPMVDKIRVGVTSNLIARLEIILNEQVIEVRELGFMNKMTWGDTQILSVELCDETFEKHKGGSKISMRFYDGIGFLGDIATINIDLTKYGNFEGVEKIGFFSKSIDSSNIPVPNFSDFKLWKNYSSFD